MTTKLALALVLIGAPAFGLSLSAAVLTPAEALSRALTNGKAAMAPSKSPQSYKLMHTTTTSDKSPAVYIFNSTEGFLAVSANTDAEAILGYGDQFDSESMPPALIWWLGEYARQIEASSGNYKPITRTEKASIAPLVSTLWNQSAPYNDDCPKFNGETSVTGCVATALAQIMRYHTWPASGSGTNSYTQNNTTISFDFSSTTFDWANMLDTYTSAATDAQKSAVATLMFGCGVSVNMEYTSTESSASSFSVPAAMVNYFNYDRGIRYTPRDYFGLNEWEDFVYNQLVEFGPVQYSGQSNDGGHSFVCDGYSSDGYFHINWGWGGMSDGYFLLTALDPGQQGIGGSTSGYNYSQDIIANVSKPKEGSQMYANILMTTALGVNPTTTEVGGNVIVSGTAVNYSIGTVNGTVSLKISPVAGGDTIYATGYAFSNLKSGYGFSNFSVKLPSDIADGTYTVSPAYRYPDGTWQDIPVKLSVTGKLIMTVSDGVCSFSPVNPGSIQATDLDVLSEIYLGQAFKLSATLTNNSEGEYLGVIAPALVNSTGAIVALADNYSIDLTADDSQEMEYIGTFNRYTSSGAPVAGSYTLYLVDTSTYQPISEGVEVTVNAATSPTISCTLKVDGNPLAVPADNVTFTANISCIKGYFGNSLTVAIFPYSSSSVSSIASYSTETVFLSEGENTSVTIHAPFAAEPGKQYMAALFFKSTQMSQVTTFTIASTTGIDSPTEHLQVTPYPNPTSDIINFGTVLTKVDAYSVSGTRILSAEDTESIDISKCPAGVYIIYMTLEPGTEPICTRIIKK